MWSSNNQDREPISKVDTAWLRMEQPTNLMMITGIIMLEEPVDFERLKHTVENRFLSFRRFRQKAVDRTNGAYWQLDPDFELDSHIRRTALPGNAGLEELQELVSELASTPLDKSKPLWQFHLIENYQAGQVLVMRIHHCIADGIALIQVLLSLTDAGPEPRPSAKSKKIWRKKRAAESGAFQRLMEPAREGLDFITHLGQQAAQEGIRLLQEPQRAGRFAREAGEIVNEFITSVTLSDDPVTRFKGPLGSRKRVAWAEPIPLHEVKAISKALGCTVNDLLIAAVTGAIHSFMVEQGDKLAPELEIRATVPVNLRPLEHAKDLGNHFGLVFLPLPVGEVNPLRRLKTICQQMDELKSSKQAVVAFGLLSTLGMGPAILQKPALEMLSRKASAVLTNVPGPQQPLYIAGTPIKEMMFWVPQSGGIGMGISILSYNNQVYFGLITDRKCVAEPFEIIKRFRPQFEVLLYLTLLADPDAPLNPEMAEAILDLEINGS